MDETSTTKLEEILGKIYPKDFDSYCEEKNIAEHKNFSTYFKELLKEKGKEKGVTYQTVFVKAEIPEKYGYKLLSGEKHTSQRDTILRLCYAAGFTLQETQRALKKYGMPELYAKIPRDALLMIAFNRRLGDIDKVNELLKEHGMPELRTSGLQE